MSSKPISDYGLLADCNSAALVDRAGSIDWLCMPRYDSDAIFARILDPDAGHWSIRPRGSFEVERRYLDGTLVIETTFTTADGVVRLTDAMAFPDGQRGHDLGLGVPHELLRLVEGVSGSVELEMELAPRPEYGLVRPLFRRTEEGGRTFGGPNQIVVTAGVPVELEEATMRAGVTVAEGDEIGFALRWAPVESAEPAGCAPDEVAARIRDIAEGWRSWENEHDIYEGPHRDEIRLSSRVLKGLTYKGTGAIVAAPTTSLPEDPGGERNWDYRFSWIRDSSLTLEALYVGACPDEAENFISYMTSSAGGGAGDMSSLQIMYGIGGEHDLSERELPHLRGWRDSRPVRVGNGAWGQTQLDVYGELLNSLYLYRDGSASSTRRSSASSPSSPTPPPPSGASRTPGCGKCEGSPSITCRPRCCAGWHWIGRRSSPRDWTSTNAPTSGQRRRTRSAMRSCPADRARRVRRTRRRSTRTSSTPRPC